MDIPLIRRISILTHTKKSFTKNVTFYDGAAYRYEAPKEGISKTEKKFLKKMSRENEFKIIPTTNTKRHKKPMKATPKNIF